jgi:AcrR family transcriptional regulator
MRSAPNPTTRERLLDAARALFFSRGVEETSVAQICQTSGVSNGSLFHHFGSKEALALEIFLEVRRAYWIYVLDAMEACEQVPDAAEASVRAAFAFQRENPEAFAFMLDTSAAPWVLRQTTALRDLNAAFADRALRWAAPHVMAGRLPALSVHTFGALIFGLPQWIAREARAGLSVPDTERCIEELASLMRRLFSAGT